MDSSQSQAVNPEPQLVVFRFYAQLRDALGKREESIPVVWPRTEPELLEILAEKCPSHRLLILASRIAYDDCYLQANTILNSAEYLDVISPVSGG